MGLPQWTWDAVLAYSTVKIVLIRDKRVGLVYYFMVLCVIAYIVGYTIIYQQRYLALQQPVGSVRLSIQSPQARGQIPTPAQRLPYCVQAQNETNGFPNKPCLFWDEHFVRFPPSEKTALFITTRVTQMEEVANCSLAQHTCRYVETNAETYFIADISNFTVMLDHSIYAPNVNVLANSAELTGELLNLQGDTMVVGYLAGDNVGVKGKVDVIHVGTLLRAAGADSLDTPSTSSGERSKRDDGLVVLVIITYSNTYSFNTNNLRYQYSLRMVESTKFKVEQPIYTKASEARVIWNRHGLRFVFLQTGELGQFDIATLLLTFVSGLGLLTIATVIVDFGAVRVTRSGRTLYSRYKYLQVSANHQA